MSSHLDPWNLQAEDFPTDGFASDQLEFLLGYAILAPSAYNTQPWQFKINAMDVEVHADRRRALGVIDPAHRALTMSCGAALFNLRVAAEYFGHQYRVELLPEPNNANLLARFHLGLQGDTSSEDVLLFHVIPLRRTNRLPFRPDPLPGELVASWEAAAQREGAWLHVLQSEENRNAAADLVAEGDRRQWADRQFREELARWVRAKPAEHGDGLPVQVAGVKDWLSFAGPSWIRTFDRGGGQAARDREIALHSPLLAVLGTDADGPIEWMKAGQAMEHVLLRARSDDVHASFLNQPVEIPELREQLAALCGRGGFPQLLLRMGYGVNLTPVPRRSVREVLVLHQAHHAGGT